MRYRILGELAITGDRGVMSIAAPRQRVVVATLLLDANHAVPVDRLVDALWGEEPPSTARGQVQICVSALRRGLAGVGEPPAIVTRSPGYLIRVADGELDLHLFDQLAAVGRAASAGHRLAEAADVYAQALSLWRGKPFAGIDSQLIQAAAAALVERRLSLVEESIDVRLELGQHHELIGELMALTTEHPVRERLRAQLMVALYRDGRQAEALDVYRHARQVFVDELGLEPGLALQRLERSILTGDPELEAPRPRADDRVPPQPTPAAVPRLLPADIPDFTGHRPLVDEIRQALTADAGSRPPRVAAISGKGGVGKTTLAVHLGHQLIGDFPDGQLYIQLRGNDSLPVSPGQALERFLRALGVPGAAIPEGLDERAEMYRDRLATRRMVVILDDAAGEDQVAALLPGAGTSAVIVTSRQRLVRLPGAHRTDLGVLDVGSAMELLSSVVGAERVSAEPASARSLVRHCGGLPLALRLAGARLAARPHWTLARLAARLDDEHRRLDELAHGGMDIRSNIAVAYLGLPAQARCLFRRLGMLEFADFETWVAAPLLDRAADEAEDVLEVLVDVQLIDVERVGEAASRYRFHDLVRVYARERLAEEEPAAQRRAALRRVVGAWLFLAGEAHRREYGGDFTVLHGGAELYPLPAHLVDRLLGEPMDWYERERLALVGTVRHAADAGLDELCWDLAMSSVTLFETRSYWEDWRETHRVALAAVRRAGNRRGEAALLYSLGALSLVQQRYDDAEQLLVRASAMFAEWGDGHALGLAQRNLAFLERIRGDTDAALARYEQALANVRAAGDAVAHAHVLSNIAQVHLERQQFAAVEELLNDALEIARQTGAKRVEAQILYRLGDALLRQGRLARGVEALWAVLALVSIVRDPIGEAYALYGLGVANAGLERHRNAESMLRRAHRLATDVGDRMLLAKVLLAQGDLYRSAGRAVEALDRASAARELSGRIGAQLVVARADELIHDLEATAG